MIVIVEGIDRVGKTTLCEKLKERGFILLKDGGLELFTEDKKEVQANASLAKIDSTLRFIEQMDKQGFNVVVDRLHLTEIVYGIKDHRSRVDSQADKRLKGSEQNISHDSYNACPYYRFLS